MMIKRILASAALVAVMTGSAAPALAETTTTDATAQTETVATTTTDVTTTAALPEESLTPGDFFYFLKRWVEALQVALTRDAAGRAALLEQQAQTRLAEAVQLADEGQTDLAQAAMTEAQAKLAEAQRVIDKAVANGEDLTELVAQVEESEVRYARAVTGLLETLPETVVEEIELLTTDLLAQVAQTQDAATQDEATVEEAEQTAEEAGLSEELAAVSPRTVLVLKAMAKASDKSLAEVFALYQQNPGLGNIAKALGLKMGPVQHAAQIEWKKLKGDAEAIYADEEQKEDEVEESAAQEAPVVDADGDADRDDEDSARNYGQAKKAMNLKKNAKANNGKGKQ